MSAPVNAGPAASEGGDDEVQGIGGAGHARRYTGVEPEPRRPAKNWLSGVFTLVAKQAKSLFTPALSYPRAFNWDGRASMLVPGAQGKVTACVSYAGCMAAAIRYECQTGKALRFAPRVFHFCTLKLDWNQGTNSYDFGTRAVASGLPYAPSDEMAKESEQLSSKGGCDPFENWPRLQVIELAEFETLEAIKHEISSNGPVVAHIALHDGFLSGYAPGTVYRPPAGSLRIGEHAICLIGYDDDKGYWIGINSSGPRWGTNGRFLLQYGACDLLGRDMPVYAPRLPVE